MQRSSQSANVLQESRRRQKELEQVERQNAAAAMASPGLQSAPSGTPAGPSGRPPSARSTRFAEGGPAVTGS